MGGKSSKNGKPKPAKRSLPDSGDSNDGKKATKKLVFDVDDGRHATNLYNDAEPPPTGWDDLARKVLAEALDLARVGRNHDGGSIYSGRCGVSMAMYYLLGMRNWELRDLGGVGDDGDKNDGDVGHRSRKEEKKSTTADMSAFIDEALHHCTRGSTLVAPRRVTFLEGRAGVLALWAALNHRAGRKKQRDQGVRETLALSGVVQRMPSSECELLYGRVGYVYSILFLQRALGNPALGANEAEFIVCQVIKSGLSAGASREFPLYYEWHGKCYLGAVHGLCGIYKILMHFPKVIELMGIRDKLKQSIDKLLATEFPSHNMPSSLGSTKDRLIHFCHGAPGFVPLCIMAAKFFKDSSYLARAKILGEVIWTRGLLEQKALGLCHGTPGNGMTFLSLYRDTGDALWLRRAQHFAVHVVHNFDRLSQQTDDPYCMFTGMLGAVVFLAGTLDPERSYFIGYEL